MLTRISSPTSLEPKPETAESMLLGCHVRIRHFTEIACRLSDAAGAPRDDVKRAATDVHRYFTVALPLHEQDENNSLHPRLRRALPDGDEHAEDPSESALLRRLGGPAADAMVEQHHSIDELVERLVPLCVLLKAAPERLSEVAPELRQISHALREIFEAHLALEEETVFPAMKQFLPQAEQDAIVAEMRARRGIE